MGGGELVHAVPVQAGIEIEAHHDGVVIGRDVDAGAAEHDHVVLQIVPDLEDGGVLEQRLELGEHHRAVDLFRLLGEHVGAAMADRDIAGEIGMERHRHADQLGAGRVDAGGLGVDRHPALVPGEGDPAIERRLVGDRLVGVVVAGRVFLQPRGVVRLDRRFRHRRQAIEQGTEAVMLEEGAQRRVRNALQLEILERLGQRHVACQLHQLVRQPRHLGMLDQIVAHLGRLHRRRRLQHRLDRAELLDQLGRGLGADALHAGDVVDAVAHQRQHFAQLLGKDAELLFGVLRSEAAIVHRVEHVDRRIGHQLHQVLVGADDGHLPALGQCRLGIAGDQVVGFPAGFLDAGQREGARGIADHRELGHQVLGRGRPLRLVLVVQLVAEGVLALVEDHCHVSRAVGLVQRVGQLPQHGRIAIDGAYRLAMLVGERRQPMIGAEDIAGAIDEIEMRHCRAGIAEPVRRTKPPLGISVRRGR
jgi:hypothetical protein